MRDLPSVLPKYMKALLKSLAFIILYISIYFAAQVAVTVIYSAMIITHMIITGQSIDWTSVYRRHTCEYHNRKYLFQYY